MDSWTSLYCIFNAIVADNLAMQGARTWAAIFYTDLLLDFWLIEEEGLLVKILQTGCSTPVNPCFRVLGPDCLSKAMHGISVLSQHELILAMGLPYLLKVPTWRKAILKYCQTSNIRHTKSQHLNASCLVLQLSLPNPLKPGVKLRMKM